MPTRSYDIPGVQATILDYQITPAAITNPGEIVVLLGDLPDTIGVSDPDNPGSTISVLIPKNVPILINSESDLGVISGDELVTALSNLGGADRHLELVNVLPMLSSELPLAICKITKRNGERPDPSNPLDLYEALEYAYESLGNYPAGRVVPMPVSIEDNVIITSRADYDMSVLSELTKTQTVDRYGSTVLDLDASTFKLNLVTGVTDYHEDMAIAVSPAVTADGTFGINFKVSINDVEIDNQTLEASYNFAPIPIIDHADADDSFALLQAAYESAHENGILKTVPFAADADVAVALADDTALADTVIGALATSGHKAIDNGASFSGNELNEMTVIINDGDRLVGYLTCNIHLGTLVGTDLSDTPIDEVLEAEEIPAIEPSTWFNDGTYIFTNSSITEVAADPGTNALAAIDYGGLGPNPIDMVESTTSLTFDKSFYSTYRYDVESEVYSEEDILIGIETSNLTVSASFNFEGLSVDGDTKNLVINGESYPTTVPIEEREGVYFVTADTEFVWNDVVTFNLYSGLALEDPDTSSFEYQISAVPQSASYDKRLVQFCSELTKDMNDCAAVIGTIPPVTISAEDISDQVSRINQNIKALSYATDPSVDDGLYLTVTTGSQKVAETGGITNFEGSPVTLTSDASVINVTGSLEFEVGDYIDLEVIKKGRYFIMENIVESLTPTLNGYEITLKTPISGPFANPNISSRRMCYLTNKKDRKGSYLAALYATEANNYGIDKAPFNYTMPGEAEIFYTRTQLDQLLDAKVTPINREAFNTSGVVIDTPTMARDRSDFTDQGTVGLVFYFIRQLRSIANARKGERFGTGDRQIVFQTELEAPFVAQVGSTIDAYDLQIDWSNLNINHTLDVSFAIREAKKLKFVKITARLF